MLSLASYAASPPTFATDFYTGLQTNLGINQGGYRADSGDVCCSVTTSPQCKVQYINQGSDHYEQGSMNRTREDSPQGTIVTWYGQVKKQMALEPGSAANSTHAYVCAQYCPTDGEFTSSVQIGDGQKGVLDKPRDLGKHAVTQHAPAGTTKSCEKWQWITTILGLLPMEKTDFYIDDSVTPAVPFVSQQVIEPFGKPIGNSDVAYLGFAPGDQSANFDIDPASIKTCPMSQNCNQNDGVRALSKHVLLARTALELAEAAAKAAPPARLSKAALVEVAADPPPPPDIDFGTDFTAVEDSIMLINQGGHAISTGDICCDASQAGQCQVQLSHAAGTRYFDLTHKRERFDDTIAGQTQVDFYEMGKSVLVNVTNGKETCQEYCPIDKGDTMDKFDPFDPFDTVKDLGAEGGLEHYRWTDVILKVIKMQTTDFFADITSTPAVPKELRTALTPFGQTQIGSQNMTWSTWTPGTPPAAKFDIAGLEQCPMSNKCQSPQMQNHRLRTRQLRGFWAHQPITDAAKANGVRLAA